MMEQDRRRILSGGRFFSPGNGPREYEAVGIAGDRIAAVGSVDHVRSVLGRGAGEVDMEGTFVMPGFMDGHCHLLSYGAQLYALDLSGCRSIEELKQKVGERADSEAEGTWIIGRGWDQGAFSERRYPRADDLDTVAPNHPVFLKRACGHAAVANSLALERAGISSGYPDNESGYLERDRHGEPIGVLHEEAQKGVSAVVPDPDDSRILDLLRAAIRRAHRAGLTSVQTNDRERPPTELLALYREVCSPDSLPFRVYLDPPYAALDDLCRFGLVTGSGNRWARIGAAKIFADGSLGARSAALSREYADDPGNHGVMVTGSDLLTKQVKNAHQMGMQVAIHAIGDRALDASLHAVRAAMYACPRPDHRHRMVHCQITRPEQIRAIAELSCIAAIQPKFVTTDLRWAEERVGEELAATSYAWRRMLEAGAACSGGSDAPVEPIEPLLGIWAAVCRTDAADEPRGGWLPDEKISVEDALYLFTGGAAYAEFADGEKGQLAPGALADLVALDRDPREVPAEEIRSIEIAETWCGGTRVHSKR